MQLVLPVLHSHDHALDNFVMGRNAPLIGHLKQQLSADERQINAQPITFVHGTAGSGKTHLLLACHQFTEIQGTQCQYIDMQELQTMPPQIVQGIGLTDVICIDNIDAIASSNAWQMQIFDVINQFLENTGKCLLVSAKNSVQSCDFLLPDLSSRLMWGTTFHLHELDESEKVVALYNHFRERGISVQQEVILFLMKRSQRDMHQLTELVEQLDSLSLQSKRDLTIPFIKQVLSI